MLRDGLGDVCAVWRDDSQAGTRPNVIDADLTRALCASIADAHRYRVDGDVDGRGGAAEVHGESGDSATRRERLTRTKLCTIFRGTPRR